jgi:hypothetical protein
MKSVVMDMVVVDIPQNFGVFFSISWEKKVGGYLQMDLTYATIHIFGGEHKNYIGQFEWLISSVIMITQETTPFMQWMIQLVLLYYTLVMMFQNQQIMTKDSLVSRKKVWKMQCGFFF